MKYTLEIQKLIAQTENKSLSYKELGKLYMQAIRIADDNDDIEWGYDLRLNYLELQYYSSSIDEMVVQFSWIINAYEMHPDLFDENDYLWMYKWVLHDTTSNPQLSMEQLNAIREDFRTRMKRNGYNDRSYYNFMIDDSIINARYDEALKYIKLRDGEQSDDMSNCEACDLDSEIDYYLHINQFDEAYRRAQPLLAKQCSCAHVPTRTFASMAVSALEAGQPDKANELFDRAEEGMLDLEKDESMVGVTGELIRYLFLTGSARAWESFERYMPWSLDADPYRTYCFANQVAGGMKLEKQDKVVELSLPLDSPLFREDNKYKVSDLFAWYSDKARSLATLFDTRNGNTAFTDNLKF